jgi:Mor family transcriptional regulator
MEDLKEWTNEIKLEDFKEHQALAKAIGVEAFIRLAMAAGGTVFYIPKADSLLQPARDRKIIKEFNGYNYKELAIKYNLSETWVRQVIQQDQLNKSQCKLFDDAVNQ